MDDNLQIREVEWLNQNQEKLLAHYQFIIEATVARFIARGFIAPEEKEEWIQDINLQLWEKKLARIKEQYNGTVLLRTYFSKVVYNTCLEIIRQKQRQPRILSDEVLTAAHSDDLDAYQRLAIRDELRRFEGFLRGLTDRRYKSELCLKLFARLILMHADIQWYEAPKTREAIAEIKAHFFQAYDHLSDKEVYQIIINLFNLIEERQTDADSLRKWVNNLVDKMIALLNGDPPAAAYDRDTIKALLRVYYESASN